jgi:hypothetical protein
LGFIISTGIVRALDRFDMAVYVEAIVPLWPCWVRSPSIGPGQHW